MLTPQQVLGELLKLEAVMGTQSANLTRLQADIVTLQTSNAALQKAVNDALTAQTAANARLAATIAQLQAGIAGDDDTAVGAAADALEAQLPTLNTIATNLEASATAEASVDPTPVLPPAFTISPTIANVAPAGQQQFTSNDAAATWAAQNGSITSAGLYTAPTTSATDIVTGTSADGKSTATATITIG